MEASRHTTGERLTLEEFRALPESDDYLFELDDGVLVREPRPRRPHGNVVMMLGHYLVEYAMEHGGRVTSETGFLLGEDPPRLYGPDIAYVREEAAAYGDPEDWYRVPPDVAVEVNSPTDRRAPMRRKVRKYLDSGAKEVWVVDPKTRTVEVHAAGANVRVVAKDETLTSRALPGFEVPIAEIFRY